MFSGWPLLLALASSDAGAAAPAAPATALEQRACQQQFRTLAKAMGSSEKLSAKDVEECAEAFRQIRVAYSMDEGQYGRWLHCKAESETAFGGPCDKMLGKLAAKKAGDVIDEVLAEYKRREVAALAALKPFGARGLIGAATVKEIES